jgi:hypothetical protein
MVKSSAALLALLLFTLVTAWQAGRIVHTFAAYPPAFDEAIHLLPVIEVAQAVRARDAAALAEATFNQGRTVSYPFFHSWLSFPAWMVSPHLTTLRLLSLLYLVAAIGVAFGLGHALCRRPELRWLAGLVSAGVTLVALPLWVYGSLVYLESAGLLLTLAALWFYLRALAEEERPARRRFFLTVTSLTVAATFLTKYNFGLFLAGGLLVNEVVAFGQSRQHGWERLLYLGGPAAVIVLAWLADPERLHGFLAYGRSQQGTLTYGQLESWLYYPRSFFRHYLTGPAALLAAGGGLLYALQRRRQSAYRVLLAYLLVSLAMLVVVPQKEPRFLYTVAAVAFLPAGPFVAAAVQRIGGQPMVRRLGWGVVTVLLIWQAAAVYHRTTFFEPSLEVAYDSGPALRGAYDYILEHGSPAGQSVHLLNSWHRFSLPALEWAALASGSKSPANQHSRWLTAGPAPEPTAHNLEKLLERLQQENVLVVVSIDGSPAGEYSGWQVVEPLLARGRLTPLAASPRYGLYAWPESYRDRLLAGDFGRGQSWQAAREAARGEFEIQLHLYLVANDG